MIKALDFIWKKPLCGVKKRKLEENEKDRQVSNGSEDSDTYTEIVADNNKEENIKNEDYSVQINWISATVNTDKNIFIYVLEAVEMMLES